MKVVHCLILGLALAASASLTSVAQQNNPHNGSWLAKFMTRGGNPGGATVVVKDSGGTWTSKNTSAGNPCLGLEWPFAVTRATTDIFEISINKSKAMRGCGKLNLTFKRVDGKTLEGQYKDGRKVTLERQ